MSLTGRGQNRMLSPKMQRMQRSIRINDGQLLGLAEKARYDCVLAGHLYKRCSDSNKWLLRWFRLYQNLLFYYDSEQSTKPTGVIFLEGCYCERLLTTGTNSQPNGTKPGKDGDEKSFCFGIMYRRENQRQYELRADTVSECKAWIDAIKMASFNKLLLQKEELEQKHLHLLQVVESEKTAKWQYTRHCEDLTVEIKKLREELFTLKKEWRLLPQKQSFGPNRRPSEADEDEEEEDPDIVKIKKVQSFFRGWLCRRRWKQIVEQYICSPHAESMRKRNCLVFRMVEAEEEYVEQLEIIISCFLRPFKMAASSKNPPCSHEDINSIFLNSETVLFLHQIFLKGLTARMDSWPTLVLGTSLGDLFDMLLPMLSIYQEYVRNHHYSLQVLTECKQNPQFASLLSRLEKKPACKGHSLEIFLTYPMHQIPRYIITLHELLAHTPPDHVEKNSLENAREKLEDLSRQMHDEVSETENIRKNLAIERMIVEGCDILLDVNQVFVRQGTLIQVLADKTKTGTRGRLSVLKHEREAIRQCFLFSNHLIITTRTHAGRLHLVESVGKISLAEVTLTEDPGDEERVDEDSSLYSSVSSFSSLSDLSTTSGLGSRLDYHSLDFKLHTDCIKTGEQTIIHLVAPTKQDKDAWVTDITQCMDNVHFDNLYNNTMPNISTSSVPQFVKSDPSLFKDDVDIRFSRSLKNCKVPQIRYATPERLLHRLTDLRFLSIDFLNTFLLTYKVFADGVQVLEALKKVFFNPEPPLSPSSSCGSIENLREEMASSNMSSLNPNNIGETRRISTCSGYSTGPELVSRQGSNSPRRISAASSASGYYSDDKERTSFDAGVHGSYKSQHWRYSFRRYEEEKRDSKEDKENAGSRDRWSFDSGLRQTNPQNSIRVSVSNASASNQWRKESVTIVESQEPMEEDKEEENQGDVDTDSDQKASKVERREEMYRRLSTSVDSTSDGQFLSVPNQPITASSSAETLTDNTITAPPTPTSNNQGVSLSSMRSRTYSDNDSTADEGDQEPKPKGATHHVPKIMTDFSSSESLPNIQKEKKASKSPASSRKSSGVSFDRIISSISESQSRKRTQSCTTAPPSSPYASYSYNFDDNDADHMAYLESRVSRSQPSSQNSSFSAVTKPGGSFTPPMPRAISNTLAKISNREGSRSPSVDKKKRGFFQRHLSSAGEPEWESKTNSPLSSPQNCSKMGVVITSARQAHRSDPVKSPVDPLANGVSLEYFLSELSDDDLSSSSWSSSANAAVAFAVATAGSSNPRDHQPLAQKNSFRDSAKRKMSITSSAATMRVLSVLRHWVTKHSQDFDGNYRLKNLSIEFLEDIICTPTLLPAEHKAASQLLRMLTREDPAHNIVNLQELLSPSMHPAKESITTLSALEIAEQMTYLDQKILFAICSEEFLGQAWMKAEKKEKAPHICLITERFNDMCRLIVSEIITSPCNTTRVERIEKWTAVADICRCLHNYNGVLQVCAAFTNSSVYRLRKTWDRIGKTTKSTIEKLQAIVSSDGRHRNLRDALHRCDPPSIPYLGIYLSDLTFIDEGTPNFTEKGLLNFAKMRMIAHVIREVRIFQQTPYKIEPIEKVKSYLLDPSLRLSDDELYHRSLIIEPRSSRLSVSYPLTAGPLIGFNIHHSKSS